MISTEQKAVFISIAIVLAGLFLLNSTMDAYNDIVGADFLYDGKKFENVDVEDLIADKYSSSTGSFPGTLPLSEFIFPSRNLPVFSPPLPVLLTAARNLRC